MKELQKIFKTDFTLPRLFTAIIATTLLTILLFLTASEGFTELSDISLFSGIMIISATFFSFILAFSSFDNLLNDPAYLINLMTAGITESILFFGKILVNWAYSLIVILINLIILSLLSSAEIKFLTLIFYFIYMAMAGLMTINLAALIKYLIGRYKYADNYGLFVVIMLLIISVPLPLISQITNPIYYIIKYFPFAVMFEGGIQLLKTTNFSLIESLYISLLGITLLLVNYLLFKKEMGK